MRLSKMMLWTLRLEQRIEPYGSVGFRGRQRWTPVLLAPWDRLCGLGPFTTSFREDKHSYLLQRLYEETCSTNRVSY
jgi:hypothetical protein